MTDGFYNDTNNWVGGVAPSNGVIGRIKMNQDRVIRFPEGGLTENSMTYAGDVSDGKSVTFNTLGTWWLKSGPDAWPESWQAFMMAQRDNNHLFNIEGVEQSAANDYPVMLMSNAVFRYTFASTGSTVALEQGFLNFYDPNGVTNNSHSLVLLGGGTAGSRILFMTNSMLRSNKFRIRGIVGGSAVRFEGGSHEIFNGVVVSEAGAGSGSTGTLQVAGGNLTVRSGNITLGTLDSASSAMDVSGDGVLVNQGDVYSGKASNSMARIWVGDSGWLAVSNSFYVGQSGKYSSSDVILTNRGQLFTRGTVYLVDNCTAVTGRVTVADESRWTALAAPIVGNAADPASRGELMLTDQGTLDARSGVNIATVTGGAKGRMVMRDQAVLRLGDSSSLGVGNNFGCGEFRLEGGRIVASNAYLIVHGSNSVAELAGGESDFLRIQVKGQTGFTNTLWVSGGEHRVWYAVNNVGLSVGENASDSLMEMTGGILRVARMGRVGYGSTGTGSAILRMRGGQLIFFASGGNSEAVFNICDSIDSKGRVELLGGEIQTQALRGWTGAANKGGTGWAELYADGGRVTAISGTSASKPLIETFDKAELGAGGLTVDSAGYPIYIGQIFTDAEGEDGLFVKTGEGVMTAVSNSSHAVTAVAGGTLTFAQTNAVFGRAVTVTNRAVLSLVGAPVTQTVARLTLGDAATFGSLAMDAGDIIHVTEAGGLSIVAGRLRFGGAATEGTYTLFRCAGTVATGDLAALNLLNAESDKSYAFSTVADGSDTLVQLVVSIPSLTDTTWTGATDNTWGTAGNWSGAAVPTLSSRAIFPTDAANKSIALDQAGEVGKLVFTGPGYQIGGTAGLTLKTGIETETAAGTATVAVPLALSGAVGFTGGNATTTTVSGALSTDYATVVKSDSGAFLLAADNPAYAGNWVVSGGRLEARSAGALGADQTLSDALTLQAGTFRWAAGSASLNKGFNVAADGHYAAILDILDDLTLTGAFAVNSGALIKRGAGRLTLNLPKSTTVLSASNLSWAANLIPSGTTVLPDTGDSPTSANGIGGLDVLAGTLCLQGQGPSATIVNQNHWTIVGGTFAAEAEAELELNNLTYNEGAAGIHLVIGDGTQANTPNHPVLRVVNQATLIANTIRLSYNPSAESHPILAVTNALVSFSWALYIGAEGGNSLAHPHLWIGEGGTVRSTGDEGVLCYRNLDVVVSAGGSMEQIGQKGKVMFSHANTEGQMVFSSGGTLKMFRLIGKNTSSTGVQMIFDGGVLELLGANMTSLIAVPDQQGFTADAGGMTIRTGSGVKHTLTFPIRGEGKLTKAGAGELVLGPGLAYISDTVTNMSGLATLQVTGGTEVQAGTLSISNDTLAATSAITVDAGATLNLMGGDDVAFGSISGTGAVSNGTLRAGYKLHLSATANDRLTLTDVTLPDGFAVTFDVAEGYTPTVGTEFAVADCAGTTEPNLSKWTAKLFGNHMGATFVQRGSVIYATLKYLGGTGVTLR